MTTWILLAILAVIINVTLAFWLAVRAEDHGLPFWHMLAVGVLLGFPLILLAIALVVALRPPPTGLMFSLLGTAEPNTLRRWFSRLTEGGEVNDPLQERPWGASDGQVTDRFGLRWLIGFERARAHN